MITKAAAILALTLAVLSFVAHVSGVTQAPGVVWLTEAQ